MPELSGVGKLVMLVGIVLVLVGGMLALADKLLSPGSGFGWLGRLPGDVLIKRDNFTFYFPLTTSILISVVLSLLLYFFSRR